MVELRFFSLQSAPATVREAFDASAAPESSWAWFVTLAESVFTAHDSIKVLALIDDQGACLSAIPLIAEGRGFRAPTSPYTTLFAPPLGRPESAFLMGQLLAKQVSHLSLDCWNESDAAGAAFVEGLRHGGLKVALYRHFANWYDKIDEFEPYWNSRPSKLKSLVQRKVRQLERDGRLRFEQIDLSRALARGTDLYERIYKRSWKAREDHPSFIATLLRHLGAAGTARLAVAHIDGRPAAAQIWLLHSSHATIFKLGHDREFESYSPGSLLTRWMLERCHQQEAVRGFDFGRGDDAYKKWWLGRRRFRYGLVAANPRSPGGLYRFLTRVVPTRIARSAIVQYLKSGVSRPQAAETSGRITTES